MPYLRGPIPAANRGPSFASNSPDCCTTNPKFRRRAERLPDADLVNGLLVFNIRQNRYRLIAYPVFSRHRLYIKALLSHKEYDRKNWVNKWP